MRFPLSRSCLCCAALGCLIATIFGCGALDRSEWLERENKHQLEHQRLQTAFQDLEVRFDNDRRERSTEKYCKEKDSKVAEFVRTLQAGLPGTCTNTSIQSSLLFMRTQPYSISNLRPNERIKDLHPARLGQLRELIEPQKIHPSTHLIVLLQPSTESTAAEQEAIQLGKALVPVLANEAHSPTLSILGPFLLPCQLRGVPKRLYNRQEDAPLPNEPGEGMPRVRIWVFRTDC